MKKRLLTILLALVTIVTGARAVVVDYGLKVGGVTVTNENADHITGSNILAGKVSFEFGNPMTLVLENAVIASSGTACLEAYDVGYNTLKELTIKLIGQNYLVDATGSAMKWDVDARLRFTSDDGTGSLTTAQAWGTHQPVSDAVTCAGTLNLIIQTATVEFATLDGHDPDNATVHVSKGGTLKAKDGLKGFKSFSFYTYEDIGIAAPADGWYSYKNHCMMAGDSWEATPAKDIAIGTVKHYGLYVGGSSVSAVNAAHIVGEGLTRGKASFDVATNTLSLDNVQVGELAYQVETYYGEGEAPVPEQIIKLTGENEAEKLYCWFQSTPVVNIQGATDDASLTVANGIGDYHFGLNVKDCKVTVKDGGLVCMDDTQGSFYLGVENGTLDVSGQSPMGSCIAAMGGIDLHLGEGIAIREPEGGKVHNEGDPDDPEGGMRFGFFVTAKDRPATHVVIGPEGTIVKKTPTLEWRVGEEKVENFTIDDIEDYEEAIRQLSLYNPDGLAVTYSSTDENVATVAADGTITVNSVGATTIAATFAGNDDYMDRKATVYLLVKKQPKPVTLEWRINDEKTESLTATGIEAAQEQVNLLTLYNPAALDVFYRTTNSKVATIAEDGTIKVWGYGETYLNAIFGGSDDYQGVTASVKLTVVDPVTHYGFGVGDVEVTSENAANITTETLLAGKAYYDPDTKTLTLDNVVISNPNDASIWGDCPELNIRLVGKNQLVDGTVAFEWEDDVMLRLFSDNGKGVLTSTEGYGDDHQPLTRGNTMRGTLSLVIDNCTVELAVTNAGSKGGSLTITHNGTLKSQGFVYGFPTQIFDENIGVIQPEMCYWDNEGAMFGYAALMMLVGPDEDGNYTARPATNVIIGPTGDVPAEKTDPELKFTKDVVTTKYGQLPIAPTLLNPYRVEPLTWTSSNADVATVDAEGVLTVQGLGRTQISVSFAGDDDYTASKAEYWLSVGQGEAQVTFNKQSVDMRLGEADVEWPVATTVPEGLELTYSSSEPTVATVDAATGVVTPITTGRTVIRATFAGNELYKEASAEYIVNINAPELKYADLYYQQVNPQIPYNMTLGGSEQQPTLYNPEALPLTYKSSDPEVATIDADGTLSLHQVGYTWVTAEFAGNSEWAPAYAGFMLGVQRVPAIDQDTDITFDSDDFDGEDLSNTTIDDVLYTLDSDQGDTYDTTDQSIVVQSTLTGDQIEAIVSTTEPGSSEFAQNYTGLSYLLKAGRGQMDIDFFTLGDRQLTVKLGSAGSATFTNTERGTIHVDYDVTEDTWVYVYASLTPADQTESTPAQRRAAVRRARAEGQPANAVKLYGISIKPAEIYTTAIRDVQTNGAAQRTTGGTAYNLQGQRVAQPAKGLYIIDGRKTVVK